ncbi:MAG: bifunctional 4-hydroxy-2-oxoglutarate aldolase/2-dehydro-3-deoxy-phosphogluconate aldolase [Actinomycetota bacterium]
MSPFEDDRVLAIVRYREPCDLGAVVDALRAGGIGAIEITADTPGALEAVAAAREAGAPVAAGTIRTVEEARAFTAAGAAFLVSPGLVPQIVREGKELGVPTVPGVLSPTEVLGAVTAGASTVKLFPASLGGVRYLGALRGPFPDVRFIPTGGIAIEDVPRWLEAGAACVGLGSALAGDAPPRTRSDLERITDEALRAVDLSGADA